MDEWLFSKEWAANEILSILRRNDEKYAMKLLIRAKNLESVTREKEDKYGKQPENRGER